MLRLLGAILFVIGLVLVATLILWFVGVWFMLFGVLLLIFGGSRRVVVHHRDLRPREDRRNAKKAKLEVADQPTRRQLRADAADDFNSAVLLYQRHVGCREPGDAIRILATDALRQQGFLK